MILSASRRTDIPNHYTEWFFNRIKEGFFYVRNPMDPRQISRIECTPQIVDCIVFWTKNPTPMMPRLHELKEYPYYFQFTLTGYGSDIEPGIPHKRESMLAIFQELSLLIGKDRMIWRYDPILFNAIYTPEYHLRAFEQIAGALRGYTSLCVISFVDVYTKNQKNLKALQLCSPDRKILDEFIYRLVQIANKNRMEVKTCAETMDLSQFGIGHNSCIDKALIEKIIGCSIDARPDRSQRPACGCMESVDIGTYNTCPNGCLYCYADHSRESVLRNCALYDKDSPLLCGSVQKDDIITERKLRSFKEQRLF